MKLTLSQRKALSEIDGYLAARSGDQSQDAAALRAKLLQAFPVLTGEEDHNIEDELQQQQKAAAFDNMMAGLREIGFGTDDPINGADAIDSINELIDDTETRFGV